LQIGQKLLISPGNVTPSPTLSALQRLTPEADGRYYHTVASGQTLSWIAARYDVPLNALLAWNGLNADSIIRPGQKLLLMVTPPATPTATPAPPTETPSPFPTPTRAAETPTPPATPSTPPQSNVSPIWGFLVIVLLAAGLAVWLGRRASKTGG
ncbi:MAG: LysM domain-containing protein, partial [Anaerolineales bacterium]